MHSNALQWLGFLTQKFIYSSIFAKRMKKMTGDCNQVENPRMISAKKCKSLISKIVKDETHPLYPYITTLLHGHLRVPWFKH